MRFPDEKTKKYVLSFKDPSVAKAKGSSGKDQVAVLLDTCVAIMTVNLPERFYLFYLAPGADQKVRGQLVTGRKTAEERGASDVLDKLRRDLLDVGFPAKKLFAVNSLPEAKKTLIDQLKVEPKCADQIVLHFIRNQ